MSSALFGASRDSCITGILLAFLSWIFLLPDRLGMAVHWYEPSHLDLHYKVKWQRTSYSHARRRLEETTPVTNQSSSWEGSMVGAAEGNSSLVTSVLSNMAFTIPRVFSSENRKSWSSWGTLWGSEGPGFYWFQMPEKTWVQKDFGKQ